MPAALLASLFGLTLLGPPDADPETAEDSTPGTEAQTVDDALVERAPEPEAQAVEDALVEHDPEPDEPNPDLPTAPSEPETKAEPVEPVGTAAKPEPPPPSAAEPPVPAEAPAERPNWRVWASPLSSLLVPGLGQFINNQGGKGTSLLFASVGSVGLAAALYALPNDGTRGAGAEYARLAGFGVFSTAAPLLWIYSIADAYRVAAKREIESHVGHKVRVSATRMMTLGFRADPARPAFYDDLSVSVMGQAAKRLTVGVSDLSIKTGGPRGPQIWQFGARIDYRVVERKRVWLGLGLGSIFQVVSAPQAAPLDPQAPRPARTRRFAAVPYGQLDLRIFVLDRLSLDLAPRIAVPVTTRYYAAQRALPRYAPTLELGAGVSTYF